MATQVALRGEKGWHASQARQFGVKRWKHLLKALTGPTDHVCLVNPFLAPEEQADALRHALKSNQVEQDERAPGFWRRAKRKKKTEATAEVVEEAEKTVGGDGKTEGGDRVLVAAVGKYEYQQPCSAGECDTNAAVCYDESLRTPSKSSQATKEESPSTNERHRTKSPSCTASSDEEVLPSVRPCTLLNDTLLAPAEDGRRNASEQPVISSGGCLWSRRAAELPEDVLTHYFLDGASALCASKVDLKGDERILDLCAAPGGKSLVLACSLFKNYFDRNTGVPASKMYPHREDNSHPDENKGSAAVEAATRGPLLVSNEYSKSRAARLEGVLRSFLPLELFERNRVRVTNLDATGAACASRSGAGELYRLGPFDVILVDAPCSTDRHLLSNAVEMARWSEKSVAANADRQLQLLWTALSLLRPGAGSRIVYSTCALSDIENTKIVERFIELARTKGGCDIAVESEQMFLPDEPHKFGPLFRCVLRKRAGGKVGALPPITGRRK
ncbi:unnamed protein product [Amoebophrya sp. A25]|nr:unnamed protein product [Amoebophrya sp. A25]|eukprot:GSA25T00013352001.1